MRKCIKFTVVFIVYAVLLVACGNSDDETNSQENMMGTEKNNNSNINNEKQNENNNNNQGSNDLSYEDFKGTYVSFKSEPYNSPIISDILVFGDEDYRTFNRWDYDMTSTILEENIDENTLTIDVDSEENEVWGAHSETGTEQFKIEYRGNSKVLYHQDVESEFTYYPMSSEDLQEHYKQSEIDYARIIMTLRGVPSLDSWAAYSSEYDGDKPVVGVTHNNKGDTIPYTDDDKDVGYPEDVTDLYLKNKTRQDEISYTYSSLEDGYIKVYPVPINHAIRTGEEVIEEAEQVPIEPFEPYEVADFIGNVEFKEE